VDDRPRRVVVTRISDRFSRRIQTRERAEETFGLPVTAEIPNPAPNDSGSAPEVEVASNPDSDSSKAYRQLAAHIERVMRHDRDPGQGDAGPRPGFTILITSARDEPARSYVAVNLAAVFADSGDRVMVATTRGLQPAQGKNGKPASTSSNGDGPTTPDAIVSHARPSWITGVSSLALGQLYPTSEGMLRGFGQFAGAAHEVVNDLVLEAPLLASREGAGLLAVVDLVVVVCECGRTAAEDGFESQRLLTRDLFLPVLGLVLANAPAH
jgi:Mrp family chromosome partitioning ATPase